MVSLNLGPISDPEGFPSDESLRALPRDEQIDTLKEWFFYNFEDPVHHTSHDSEEGGYLYIWGGPYDAREELNNRFQDIEDEVFEAAIEEIEDSGVVWAPNDRRIFDEDDAQDEESFPATDQEWRTTLSHRVTRLEKSLAQLTDTRARIGHNKPPEALADESPSTQERADIQKAILEIKVQLSASRPDVGELTETKNALEKTANSIGTYVKFKLDKVVDGAAESIGATLAAGLLAGIAGYSMYHALVSVLTALRDVVDAVAAWIQFLTLPF